MFFQIQKRDAKYAIKKYDCFLNLIFEALTFKTHWALRS